MQPSNFQNKDQQKAYVEKTKDSKELIQKELDVNLSEQILLKKRIQIMEELVNDLPSSDPQYNMLTTQLKMDQLEIDELKVRATLLVQKIESTKFA